MTDVKQAATNLRAIAGMLLDGDPREEHVTAARRMLRDACNAYDAAIYAEVEPVDEGCLSSLLALLHFLQGMACALARADSATAVELHALYARIDEHVARLGFADRKTRFYVANDGALK